MARPSRTFVSLLLVALLAASCARDDGETESGTSDPPPEQDGGGDGTDDGSDGDDAFASGGFGELESVCKDGDPAPVTVETPGLTDTEVRVATFTDVGFEGRPGLNQEFLDTAEAFVAWCNSHGGINGREIVLAHRDAKLSEYQQRMIEACAEDFFMVGGGAVFDEAGQADRLACGLPDISGFMVTAAATESDLHLEPVPNPAQSLNVTDLIHLKEQHPEAITKVWDLHGSLPTLQLVSERVEEAALDLGYEIVHTAEYNPGGEANWKPFAQAAKDKGAEAMFWVGEPENLAAVMEAADEIGLDLAFARADANHYDPRLIELGGSAVDPVLTKTTFFPFERADENPATRDYLRLIDEFKPGGKVALLGAQGLSGWLLFATAATECDEAGTFTRDCIFEAASVTEWTGAGLHSPQDVASRTAGECQALLVPGEGGDFVDAPGFDATDGPWSCSPDAVATLTGDYGTGAKCPSGVEDPLPSTCA